ncbi:hypothetical protein ABE454_14955 [Brevundimonas diminuta]
MSDGAGRHSIAAEVVEYLVEDVDLAGVGVQFALADDVIAIAAAAAREAGFHPCGQAATRLHRQIVQEEFVHCAFQPDVNPVDRAFGQGLQVEQALVDVGDVLLVARQSVERFGHDVADCAALPGGEEGAQSGAVGDRAAGSGLVREQERVCDALGSAGAVAQRLEVHDYADREGGLSIGRFRIPAQHDALIGRDFLDVHGNGALPIKRIHDRWISEYAGHALSLIDRLKGDLEGRA